MKWLRYIFGPAHDERQATAEAMEAHERALEAINRNTDAQRVAANEMRALREAVEARGIAAALDDLGHSIGRSNGKGHHT